MVEFDQFEIWAKSGDRWEIVAGFQSLEVAKAVLAQRRSRVRLVRSVYHDGKLHDQQLLDEVQGVRNAG